LKAGTITVSKRRRVAVIKRPHVYAWLGAGGGAILQSLREIKTTICFAGASRLNANDAPREYPTEGSTLFGKRFDKRKKIYLTFVYQNIACARSKSVVMRLFFGI